MADVTFLELCVMRHACIATPTLTLLVHRGDLPYPKKYRFLLLANGVTICISLGLQFYSLKYAPLPEATVIIFSSPVFVVIFACLILGEKCTSLHCVMILLTVTGIVFIARPPFIFKSELQHYTTQNWWGIGAATGGSILSALFLVIVKLLKDLHYSVILHGSSVIALILSSLLGLYEGDLCTPQHSKDRVLLFAFGAVGFIGFAFNTKALETEEVGLVSIVRTSSVVFTFMWQALLFQDYPDLLTLVGTLLVVSCVAFTGLYKWIKSLSPTSTIRKKMACLLS